MTDCRLIEGDGLHVKPPAGAIVITDPPYAIDLKNNDRAGKTARKGKWRVPGDGAANHAIVAGALTGYLAAGFAVCAFASPKRPWPGRWPNLLVWDKGPAVGGGGDIATCWKPTWELIQVGGKRRLNGNRDPAILRYWIGPNALHHHPSQKPIALMEYLVGKLTQPGDTVFDPCAGSASTAVACINLGRNFVGYEIDPEYHAVGQGRIAEARAARDSLLIPA